MKLEVETNEASDMVESLDEFLESCSVHIENNGPINILDNAEKWFEKVEDSHVELREFIGGIRRSRIIETEQGQRALSKEETREVFNKLQGIWPGIIAESYLSYPTMMEGTHKANKVNRLIANVYTQYLDSGERDGRISQQAGIIKREQLNKTLAQLGQLWAKAKCEKRQIKITLTTSAIAFLMLGHYGVDHDSCFRNDASNNFAKVSLGQNKNTFVVKLEENDKIIARCWGFCSDDFSTFYTCNLYLKGIEEETFKEAMKDFFIDLIGREIYVHLDKSRVGNGVYQNPYARFSFSTSKDLEIFNWWPECCVAEYMKCQACLRNKQEAWCGETRYCLECCQMKKLKFDELNQMYATSLVPVYKNDQKIDISDYIRQANYVQCRQCTNYVNKDTIYQLNGNYWCEKCYNNYLEAESKKIAEKAMEVKVDTKPNVDELKLKFNQKSLKKERMYEFRQYYPHQDEE